MGGERGEIRQRGKRHYIRSTNQSKKNKHQEFPKNTKATQQLPHKKLSGRIKNRRIPRIHIK